MATNRSRSDGTSLGEARELIRERLSIASRGAVPSPPASRLLQRSGLEATIEQRICGESLGYILKSRSRETLRNLLVVDLSTTGRAATVWLGNVTELFAQENPEARVTLALPGTRDAGRGRLLNRHLEGIASKTGIDVELICGPASVQHSAPVEDEADRLRSVFDTIVVVSLAGSAGIGASWPDYPGQRWLDLADCAVLTFIDPDSLVADLDRFSLLDSGPPRIRVETLTEEEPKLVGRIDVAELDTARKDLPHLIETARRSPWRAVAEPPLAKVKNLSAESARRALLSCPSETAAKAFFTETSPLEPRRALVAGRLRILAAMSETPSS